MKNMVDNTRQNIVGLPVMTIDLASPERDYTSVLDLSLMLDTARNEERANRAVVFAGRLEAIASFILKREMTGIEAAEALRIEANRIQSEAEA
ncbi:DUF2732 family protein [Rahnella sp. BCC 1045]|uniref:DUF2732 family protein n=1 Tax=Rahnella sp. BCC 1045 TaxID=2816251 RepID=UPI0020B6F1AA|nr:DUF2732 family protein [Rahnella sp. BCC 1045]